MSPTAASLFSEEWRKLLPSGTVMDGDLAQGNIRGGWEGATCRRVFFFFFYFNAENAFKMTLKLITTNKKIFLMNKYSLHLFTVAYNSSMIDSNRYALEFTPTHNFLMNLVVTFVDNAF